MGQITQEMRAKYGRPVDWIPKTVLERIDEDEVLDRLDEAADLIRKVDRAPAELARGYMDMARIVLEAEPRDETERLAAVWTAKADDLHVLQLPKADGSRPEEAIELLDHADDLISGRLNPRLPLPKDCLP